MAGDTKADQANLLPHPVERSLKREIKRETRLPRGVGSDRSAFSLDPGLSDEETFKLRKLRQDEELRQQAQFRPISPPMTPNQTLMAWVRPYRHLGQNRRAAQAPLTDDEILANGISQLGIKSDRRSLLFASPSRRDSIYATHLAATGAPPSLEATKGISMDVVNAMRVGSDEEARATMLALLSNRDSAKRELQDVIKQLQASPITGEMRPPSDMRILSEKREELTHEVNFFKALADFIVEPEFIKMLDDNLLRDATFNGR